MPDPKQTENDSRSTDGDVVVECPRATESKPDGETLRRALVDLLKRRREEKG